MHPSQPSIGRRKREIKDNVTEVIALELKENGTGRESEGSC